MNNSLNELQMRRKIIYLNAIISVLVVWIHTYNIGIYDILPDTPFNAFVYHFEEYLHRFEEFCVPFFFTLSGYLFFANYELSFDTVKRKYTSRIKTLVIPFILWNFIGFAFYGFMTHFPPTASRMNMDTVEISLKKFLETLWTVNYNGSLWYLRNLILLVAISPVIYILIKNYGKFYVGIITLILVAIYIFTTIGVYLYDRYDRCIYYFIGAYIAVNHKDFIYKRKDKLAVVVLIVAMIMNIFVTDIEFINFIRITGSVFAVWFLPIDILLDKEPAWYMKISFFVYCIHTLILETFEKLWFVVAGRSALAALADYLFMPIIVITFISIIAKYLKKILPAVWNVLTGSRG